MISLISGTGYDIIDIRNYFFTSYFLDVCRLCVRGLCDEGWLRRVFVVGWCELVMPLLVVGGITPNTQTTMSYLRGAGRRCGTPYSVSI